MGPNNTQSGTATAQLPLLPTKRLVLLTLEDFQAHLAQLAKQAGSNAETGRRLGVSGQFIDLLIDGKRTPGPKLLKAIGARRVTMIEIEVEGPSE